MDVNEEVEIYFLSVLVNDSFTVTAEEKFGTETLASVFFGSEEQILEIHTSCSKPIAVGDKFGSLLITNLVFVPK
jgi:hypothetical protein